MHNEWVRYVGLGSTVACFHCEPVAPNLVALPPRTISYSPQLQQEWLRQELQELAKAKPPPPPLSPADTRPAAAAQCRDVAQQMLHAILLGVVSTVVITQQIGGVHRSLPCPLVHMFIQISDMRMGVVYERRRRSWRSRQWSTLWMMTWLTSSRPATRVCCRACSTAWPRSSRCRPTCHAEGMQRLQHTYQFLARLFVPFRSSMSSLLLNHPLLWIATKLGLCAVQVYNNDLMDIATLLRLNSAGPPSGSRGLQEQLQDSAPVRDHILVHLRLLSAALYGAALCPWTVST